MRILNVMLSGGRGGIEAAFANYAVALKTTGDEVVCCVTPKAAIRESLTEFEIVTLPPYSQFDLRVIVRAAKLLRSVKPDVVLVHGRRALMVFVMARKLFGIRVRIVQVLHRPRFKNLRSVDHVITVSAQLREQVLAHGLDAKRVSHIPNFLPVEIAPPAPRAWHATPVIGALGRMVPEKGFDIFLDALAILREKNIAFAVRIGGSGALLEGLQARANELGLGAHIEWLGWVSDTAAFYESIDIFCLPSRAESFGLVVLEAFAYGALVASTRTSGPSELIVDGENGLLCEMHADAIAAMLMLALEYPERAAGIAAKANADSARYALATVAPQISACLRAVSAAA